jgi:N-acetylglucosamine-6-phosphate deacetylase
MTTNAPASILLRNARVVLPEKTIDAANLLIEQGRIAAILDLSKPLPSASSMFDLTGMTLLPGFIDVHIHGAAGVDTMNASADGLHRVSSFLARNGITGWLPTLVPDSLAQYQRATESIDNLMADQRKDLTPGEARALGVHYEGPFVNDQQCGALHREHFRTFGDLDDLNLIPRLNESDANHMMTVAPEIQGGVRLIEELTKQRWIVSIGHTRATSDLLDQARDAGARHMTHFMNAMTPLHHRAPGPVDWGLMNDGVTCDLIADGIHLNPSIIKLIMRNKTPQRVSLISDAIAAAGMGDGQYEIWDEQIAVKDGRTQNSKGSIAGSVITMLDAVRLILSLGFSENEVAQMSSTNPARLLRIDDDCGSIEPGKRADLVALDKAKHVRLTVVGGQIAFQDLS